MNEIDTMQPVAGFAPCRTVTYSHMAELFLLLASLNGERIISAYLLSVPAATSAALRIFYGVAIPYEPYGDLTMTHSLPFLPATDTAHPPMSIPAC